MPVPTQDVLFERVVDVFDAVAEDRGWGSPSLLIGIGCRDEPGAEVELAVKEIDEHPAEALMGFTAPGHWTAIGVSAEGWAFPYPEATDGHPSGNTADVVRERVRTLVLVSRDGRAVGKVRWQDGRVVEEAPAEGLVLECLRLALKQVRTPHRLPG